MSPKGEYTDSKVKVTIRLPPELVKQAKHRAIEDGATLQDLIERGLAIVVSPAPRAGVTAFRANRSRKRR